MHNSVWVECGGDPGFLAECFESGDNTPLLRSSTDRKLNENEDPDKAVLPSDALCDKEPEDDAETNKPRFTLQELRDVLQEKNELKAQVFMLQEELAYYKSEESDDESGAAAYIPSLDPPPQPPDAELPESGIKRLMFTAVMPMVAAGLLRDDPTLLPIRRLISFV